MKIAFTLGIILCSLAVRGQIYIAKEKVSPLLNKYVAARNASVSGRVVKLRLEKSDKNLIRLRGVRVPSEFTRSFFQMKQAYRAPTFNF